MVLPRSDSPSERCYSAAKEKKINCWQVRLDRFSKQTMESIKEEGVASSEDPVFGEDINVGQTERRRG